MRSEPPCARTRGPRCPPARAAAGPPPRWCADTRLGGELRYPFRAVQGARKLTGATGAPRAVQGEARPASSRPIQTCSIPASWKGRTRPRSRRPRRPGWPASSRQARAGAAFGGGLLDRHLQHPRRHAASPEAGPHGHAADFRRVPVAQQPQRPDHLAGTPVQRDQVAGDRRRIRRAPARGAPPARRRRPLRAAQRRPAAGAARRSSGRSGRARDRASIRRRRARGRACPGGRGASPARPRRRPASR